MAELVESKHFLAWAADRGIGRSRAYPDSPSLTFLSDDSTWYRFRPNVPPDRVAWFVRMAAKVATVGGDCWLYPPEGGGQWVENYVDLGDWVATVLQAQGDLGIPVGYVGAVCVRAAEFVHAASVLAVAMDAGCFWSLSLIPEHAMCIVTTEEDGDLIGDFPHGSLLSSYTGALVDAGWVEPTEPDPRVSETDPWLDL